MLKDAWVDAHRERPGQIDAKIRESAAALSEADQAQLSRILLTIVCHGDVLVADAQDCTKAWSHPREATGEAHSKTVRHRVLAPSVVPQVRYRVVFREVCTSLNDVSSLPSVYNVLANVCEGELRSPPRASHPRTNIGTQVWLCFIVVAGCMATSARTTSYFTMV